MPIRAISREQVVGTVAALVALVVASLPAVTLTQHGQLAGTGVVIGLLVLCLGLALRSGSGPAVRLTAVATALVVPLVIVGPVAWPFHFVLAAAIGLVPPARLSVLAGARPWLRRGRWTPALPWIVLVTIFVAGLALLAWGLAVRPDVGPFLGPLQGQPVPIAIAGVLGFALINAALEEAVFRGVAQTDLTSMLGWAAALLVQAVCFGLMHINGFPSGPVGVAMAITYGLVLGVARRTSDGMLAPYLTHITANLTIGILAVTVL